MFLFLEKLRRKKLPKRLRAQFLMREDFKKNLRSAFLSEYRKSFSSSRTSPEPFILFLRFGTAFLFLFAILGGTATYADAINAGPTNPLLYPLKRYVEPFRVAFAPEEKHSEIYLEFAARRLEEIQELKKVEEKGREDARVPALVREIETEVKKSFRASPAPQAVAQDTEMAKSAPAAGIMMMAERKAPIDSRLIPICRFLGDARRQASSVIEEVLDSTIPSSTDSFRAKCAEVEPEEINDAELSGDEMHEKEENDQDELEEGPRRF